MRSDAIDRNGEMLASTGRRRSRWHRLAVLLSIATGILLALLQMVQFPLASLRRLNGVDGMVGTSYSNDNKSSVRSGGFAGRLIEPSVGKEQETPVLSPTATPTTLTTTPAAQPVPTTNTTSVKSCQWTVLAGDSNTRKLYQSWQQQAKQQLRFIKKKRSYQHDATGGVFEAPRLGEMVVNGTDCDPRWMDHEMVLLFPSSPKSTDMTCHIVTFRFLHHQAKVLDFYQNWSRAEECGTRLQDWNYAPEPPPQQQPFLRWTRPPRPHLIWLNHGLWKLPNQGIYNATLLSTLSCETRFQAILRAIQHWTTPTNTTTNPSDIVTQVVWQTLFPIHNQHPAITDQYIDWDYQCQLQTMIRHFDDSATTVEVMDMYQVLAHENRWQQMLAPGDFHLNQNGLAYLLNKLLTKTRTLPSR